MASHGVTTVEVKSGYGLDVGLGAALAASRRAVGRRGPSRDRANFPRCARDRARVPRARRARQRPTWRTSSTSSCRGSSSRASRRRATCSASAASSTSTMSRRLLTRASDLGLNAATPCRPAQRRRAAPSSPPRLALRPRIISAEFPKHGIEALGAAADSGPAGRGNAAADQRVLPRRTSFRAGPRARRPWRSRCRGHGLQPGNVTCAERPARARLRCSPAAPLRVRSARGDDDQCGRRAGARQDARLLEEGKHADLVVWQPESYTLLPYWLGANLVQRRRQARPDHPRGLRAPSAA